MFGIAVTTVISAMIVICVVFLIRHVAGKQISKMAFMLIWGIVTLRLLIPYGFETNLSIWNFVDNPFAQDALQQTQGFGLIDILLSIWVAGTAIFGLYFFVTHTRFRKSIRDAVPVTNAYVLDWQKYNATFRPIKIKQSDKIASPLTFGIFKPVIILPDIIELYEEEEIRHILTHEYVHIRRFDYLSKILLAVALSIHWFNPLVWLMYFLANRDIEMSCDEIVVKALDKKSSAHYAMTLINAADSQNQLAALYSGFAKHALEERVQAILQTKKKSNIGASFAIGLTVATLLIFSEPVAALINHHVQFRPTDGQLIINDQEFNLDDHRNESGTPIIIIDNEN